MLLDPKLTKGYIRLSGCYAQKGNLVESMPLFYQEMLSSYGAGPFYGRGLAYYASGEYNKALAEYKKAVTLEKNQEAFQIFIEYFPTKKASDCVNVRDQIIELIKP